MMSQANKASLADSLWSTTIDVSPKPSQQVQYVLDEGALLHKIPWTKGSSWDDILRLYTKYVVHRYKNALLIFDGYNGLPSTKDSTHSRRSGGSAGVEMLFNDTMVLQTKKEEFLTNPKNKQ